MASGELFENLPTFVQQVLLVLMNIAGHWEVLASDGKFGRNYSIQCGKRKLHNRDTPLLAKTSDGNLVSNVYYIARIL